MRTELTPKTDSNQKRKPLTQQPVLWLGIMAVLLVYAVGVRPFLKPAMSTVGIELVFSVGIIILAVGSALLTIGTLMITLFVALITREKTKIQLWLLKVRSQFIIFCALLLVLTGVVLASQVMAYTPPILGENGNRVSGSIASLEKVKLNGRNQWLSIRGKNTENPVLLFLAGGPGGTQMAATRLYLSALEEHFVVVSWDQPGAAKSYHAVPNKELTPERYVSDGLELTQYLRKRFNKEKIYVIGESWGSALGIWLVQQHPEWYHAFIGTGQMVSFVDTELICYDTAMKIAEERGDTATVETLKNQGLPPYYGKDVVWKEATYLMYLFSYMAMHPEITGPTADVFESMLSPEYGLYDKVNFIRGTTYTFNDVYQQLYDIDLRKQAVKLEVPVYILHGRYDFNAPVSLVEEYYQVLNAPSKKMIWFEHSGHNPWIEEAELFVDTMVNVVLKETNGK